MCLRQNTREVQLTEEDFISLIFIDMTISCGILTLRSTACHGTTIYLANECVPMVPEIDH